MCAGDFWTSALAEADSMLRVRAKMVIPDELGAESQGVDCCTSLISSRTTDEDVHWSHQVVQAGEVSCRCVLYQILSEDDLPRLLCSAVLDTDEIR
jgi:hypothetical protein